MEKLLLILVLTVMCSSVARADAFVREDEHEYEVEVLGTHPNGEPIYNFMKVIPNTTILHTPSDNETLYIPSKKFKKPRGNLSCFYNYISVKKDVEPWKLTADDLIEFDANWRCITNESKKFKGFNIGWKVIQMSCKKEQYMILNEFYDSKGMLMTNPTYREAINHFNKPHYLHKEELDSFVNYFCKP